MRPAVTASMLGTGLLALAPTAARAQSEVFIEYRVTGTVTVSGRDPDVVLCSPDRDGRLQVHTLGAWVFTIELPSADPGEYQDTLRVAAPDSVRALHDGNLRTDDRLTGPVTAVLERAGAGAMGVPLVRIRFRGTDLTSEAGAKADVAGTIVCPLM